MYGMGSATRDNVAKVYVSEEHNKSLHGCESPGPCNYSLDASVGIQHHSHKHNQPRWVFTSANRFGYDHISRSANSPGPGSYTMTAAVGQQFSSTKTSAPMPGMGTSNRDQMQKVYISAEHEKSSTGNCSPGPCSYAVPDGNGKQTLSRWVSGPRFGFGSSKRWETKAATDWVPGPGAYCT